MKLHIPLGGVVFFFCAATSAQTLRIVDSKTGEPLPFAVAFCEKPLTSVLADSEGRVDFSSLSGCSAIHIRAASYAEKVLSPGQLRNYRLQIELVSDPLELQPVVISAGRWLQAKNEVPVKVRVIEPELDQPQTSADLLGKSGEVFVQKSQQGGGSPMIRGFATNRLLIAVDGVRMNTAIFRSGNVQNIISIDPFSVQQAEVLFGPGSVMYGSDALAGVMSFYTLAPERSKTDSLKTGGRTHLRYSSANGEKALHTDLKLGWKRWAVVLSGSFTDFGDLRMGSHGPEDYLRPWYVQTVDGRDQVVFNPDPLLQVPSAYAQSNMLGKLQFAPDEHWSLTYALHYSNTTDYARYDRLLRTRGGLPRSAEWLYGPQLWNLHHLEAVYSGESLLWDQLRISAAYQRFEESRIDRDYGDSIRRSRVEEVDAYTLNVDFAKGGSRGTQWLYGAEAVLNQVASAGSDLNTASGIETAGPSRYPNSDWSSWGLYADWKKNIYEKLTFEIGARYSFFGLNADFENNLEFYPFPFSTSTSAESQLTGQLGIEWQAGALSWISLHAASGFRAPNVDDLGKVFDSQPGSVLVPNPDLKSESIYSAELDFRQRFSNILELDVAVYYSYLDRAMVVRPSQLNGSDSIVYDGERSQVQSVQNAAFARVWGIEAKVRALLGGGFAAYATASVQQGEEELEDGSTDPLRHAAPGFGRLGLTYEHRQTRLEAYLLGQAELSAEDMPQEEVAKDYLYALDHQGLPYSPSWYTLNLQLRQKLPQGLVLFASLENITDRRYRPYSSGLSAPGRNWVLGVQLNF